MSLKPSYPDVGVGAGFIYIHKATDQSFKHPTLSVLRGIVDKFHSANGLKFNNDEFDDNVCHSTPNIVCTEGLRGLGDLVHVVLNPIGNFIDGAIGTNIGGCGGCAKRQELLNKL
jgi:hypothetical protein